MDLHLSGKRAVATGASRGIGYAIADILAAEGAHVVLLARGAEALTAAADRIRRPGGEVLALSTDTTDDAAVRATIDTMSSRSWPRHGAWRSTATPSRSGAEHRARSTIKNGAIHD